MSSCGSCVTRDSSASPARLTRSGVMVSEKYVRFIDLPERDIGSKALVRYSSTSNIQICLYAHSIASIRGSITEAMPCRSVFRANPDSWNCSSPNTVCGREPRWSSPDTICMNAPRSRVDSCSPRGSTSSPWARAISDPALYGSSSRVFVPSRDLTLRPCFFVRAVSSRRVESIWLWFS